MTSFGHVTCKGMATSANTRTKQTHDVNGTEPGSVAMRSCDFYRDCTLKLK